jgi:hypothetical protein
MVGAGSRVALRKAGEAEARAEPDEGVGSAGATGASGLGSRRAETRGAGGGGAACTTTGLLPVASDRAAGGESSVLTTSAGRVTAAASVAPISAATAIIVRLLFTSPRFAESL